MLVNKIFHRLFSNDFPAVPYRFRPADAYKVARVVISGKMTHDTGVEITKFEKSFAAYHGSKFAYSVNSGTSALEIAIKALGIKPGDEIVIPAYTFIAAAQAVLANNGLPVFADIDDTFCLDPSGVNRLITPKTRAIIVVHMFGNIGNLKEILRIARTNHLAVIEDCAQAIGAKYKNHLVGTFGSIGCFSFNEKKALPLGQGGMVITNHAGYANSIKLARNTGVDRDGLVRSIGHTYYLTEMQAALGNRILPQINALNDKRRRNYQYLEKKLNKLRTHLSLYRILPEAKPSFSRLAFRLNLSKIRISRDRFLKEIQESGVPWKTFYPTPLYRYPLFKNHQDLSTGVSFPFNLGSKRTYQKLDLAESFFREQIGMEFSPYLTNSNLDLIIDSLEKAVYKYKK